MLPKMADITCAELKERQNNNEILNIVDVRETYEYDAINMGALNIPLGLLPHKLSELAQFKNQELIIHCKSGRRSDNAKKFLEQQGFSNVRNLLGGIDEYSITA
jgi:rhodanese-related sulfurtransferase